jgi:hypothetical protein
LAYAPNAESPALRLQREAAKAHLPGTKTWNEKVKR